LGFRWKILKEGDGLSYEIESGESICSARTGDRDRRSAKPKRKICFRHARRSHQDRDHDSFMDRGPIDEVYLSG
jgi:hypothetical protein